MTDPAPPARVTRRRWSILVTLLGVLVMAAAGLLSIVSFFALLMIVAGSYGSQTSDPLGFLTVIVAPPLSVIAGLGLILRWRWSRYYLLLLFAVLIGANIAELARGGVTTTRHTTAAGVVATSRNTWGGPNRHSIPIITACAAGIVVLLLPAVRREFHPPRVPRSAPPSGSPPPLPQAAGARDWRAGHRGRDSLYYEEWHDGEWRRIEIGGEMLIGRPHHVVYVPSPEKWLGYPEWARHRRDEILGRLRSELAPPDYDYYFEGQSAPPAPAPAPTAAAVEAAVKPSQWLTLAAVIAIMLAIAAGMAWLVKTGLERGETVLPLKQPSLRRTISRDKEPATFWLSIGTFSVVGLGATGFAAWLTWEGWLLRRRSGSRA